MILFYLLLIFASPLFAQQKSWLQSFPDIRFDEKRAYFSNEKWTGVYDAQTGAMFTIPRDSMPLPEPSQRNVAIKGLDVYICGGPGMIFSPAIGLETEYALPDLAAHALKEIASAWKIPENLAANALEITGPCIWNKDKIWFGLRAELPREKKVIGGIGWYDPIDNQIGRVYTAVLDGLSPNSICVRADTIYACFDDGAKENKVGKLISYAISTGQVSQMDPRGSEIPGESVLGVAAWYNVLLVATDQAVAVWDLSPKPRAWTTKAVSARSEIWTKAILFDKETGKPTAPPVNFFPLRVNAVSEVMARLDDWIEVVIPIGIEGYCYYEEWPKYAKIWATNEWNCENLCFARIRVPRKDGDILGDFLNTPITAIEMQKAGVKVGFAAGWVDINQVTPVLIPTIR